MKHAVSRELYSYWDELRKGRSSPERTDILSVGQLNEAALSIRLSGTRLNALFMREMKGCSILDLWLAEDRGAVERIFHTVLDDAAPLVAGLRGAPVDHQPVDLEMVLLPLRHQGRTHARILGSIAPVEMPSWLGLVGIEELTLTSLRLIDTAASSDTAPWRAAQAIRRVESVATPRRYGRFLVHEGGR